MRRLRPVRPVIGQVPGLTSYGGLKSRAPTLGLRYSSSGGYKAAFRRLFRRKSVWTDEAQAKSIRAYQLTARELKQVISISHSDHGGGIQDIQHDTDASSPMIKNLILQIVEQSRNELSSLDLSTIGIIDQALNQIQRNDDVDLLDLFSTKDFHDIYTAIFDGNDITLLYKDYFSLLTKLYSCISANTPTPSQNNHLLNPEQRLSDGIKYFGLLRAGDNIEESIKLLDALLIDRTNLVAASELVDLDSNDSISVDLIIQIIHYIRDLNPDIESLKLISERYGALSVLVLRNIISALSSISQHDPVEFNSLMDKLLSGYNDNGLSKESIIVILDTCLDLDKEVSQKCVETTIKTHVMPNLNNGKITFDNEQEEIPFYELVLISCSKYSGLLEQGDQIYELLNAKIGSELFVKETWDIVVQWIASKEALTKPPGSTDITEIKNVLHIMIDRDFLPDDSTLNAVLEASVNRSAECFESILKFFKEHLGVFGDVQTYSLILDKALKKGDTLLAKNVFEESVEKYGCSWTEPKHRAMLDELLVNLAGDPFVDGQDVFNVYQRVRVFSDDHRVGYKAKVALLATQLSRESGFVDDVGRLLEEEFSVIDPNGKQPLPVPAESIPEAYSALIERFYAITNDESAWRMFSYMNRYIKLPSESYIPIIQKFCSLKRPDAALLIFKSYRLRHKSEPDFPAPGPDMYVVLFHEFGQMRYEEGVFQTHAFFKMDLEVENDTPVMNSILKAYHLLKNRSRTMDTYLDILSFPLDQSVNNDTVSIMMRELATNYEYPAAEEYWSEVFDKFGFAPNEDNLKEYLIGNCTHGLFLRALNVTKHMKQDYGIEPTPSIVETLYNFTILTDRKQDVKLWALESCPNIWQKLESERRLKHDLVIPPGDGNYRELPKEIQARLSEELLGIPADDENGDDKLYIAPKEKLKLLT